MSEQDDSIVEAEEDEVEEGVSRGTTRICYHTRLPCTKDGKCASCALHKYIQSDEMSKRELLKVSNSIRLPSVRPYVKFTDPSGRLAIEAGIKGTF